jgi:hypothetical protein
MTEQVPVRPYDEPLGDSADQASMLQMVEEQAAIRAALEGRVEGTDAIEGRGPFIENLEGPDALDGDSADASDDQVYGGGSVAGDPEEIAVAEAEERVGMSAPDADADVLDDDIEAVDTSTEAEDLDALTDVLPETHDPDDPQDPDGYGVPPGDGSGDVAPPV